MIRSLILAIIISPFFFYIAHATTELDQDKIEKSLKKLKEKTDPLKFLEEIHLEIKAATSSTLYSGKEFNFSEYLKIQINKMKSFEEDYELKKNDKKHLQYTIDKLKKLKAKFDSNKISIKEGNEEIKKIYENEKIKSFEKKYLKSLELIKEMTPRVCSADNETRDDYSIAICHGYDPILRFEWDPHKIKDFNKSEAYKRLKNLDKPRPFNKEDCQDLFIFHDSLTDKHKEYEGSRKVTIDSIRSFKTKLSNKKINIDTLFNELESFDTASEKENKYRVPILKIFSEEGMKKTMMAIGFNEEPEGGYKISNIKDLIKKSNKKNIEDDFINKLKESMESFEKKHNDLYLQAKDASCPKPMKDKKGKDCNMVVLGRGQDLFDFYACKNNPEKGYITLNIDTKKAGQFWDEYGVTMNRLLMYCATNQYIPNQCPTSELPSFYIHSDFTKNPYNKFNYYNDQSGKEGWANKIGMMSLYELCTIKKIPSCYVSPKDSKNGSTVVSCDSNEVRKHVSKRSKK